MPSDSSDSSEEDSSDNDSAKAFVDLVDWSEAATYQGQRVTVVGQVVATYHSDKVTYLNFDQDYRNTFKVVIFPDALALFAQPPEIYYKDMVIHVTGDVTTYRGAPQIIVNSPDQIDIPE